MFKKTLTRYHIAIGVLPVTLFFRTVFQQTVLENIDYFLLLITLLFLFIKFISKKKKKKIRVPLFIILVLLWIPISVCFNESFLESILGAVTYILPFLYMFLLVNVYDGFEIVGMAKVIVGSSVIMAIFGIYQRFFDMSLFGIAARVNFNYTGEFLQNATYYRISSLFQSYQVFALFQGLSIVLLLSYWNVLFSKKLSIFFGIIILFSGLISGSQIFVLVLGTYFVSQIVKRLSKQRIRIKRRTFVYSCILVVPLIILGAIFSNEIWKLFENSFSRIFLIFKDLTGFLSHESIRIERISAVFRKDIINVLLGNGLGTSSYLAKNLLGDAVNQYTTESFLFSIWYEMGVLGFSSFLFFMTKTIWKLYKQKNSLAEYLLCGLAAMIFTPTFYTVPMFPMFSLVFYGYLKRKGRGKDNG